MAGLHRRQSRRAEHLSTFAIVLGSILAVTAGLVMPSLAHDAVVVPGGRTTLADSAPLRAADAAPVNVGDERISDVPPVVGGAEPTNHPGSRPTASPTPGGGDPAAQAADDGSDTGTDADSPGQPLPQPDTGTPPDPSSFPTAATTGVPSGTELTTRALNDGGGLKITKSGTVLDKVHVRGNLVIAASNVVITNSQIDGTVVDENGSFTISDSTVGPTQGCIISPGVGDSNYTATRVNIRGHDDGFRASGPNIVVEDSFVHLCGPPGSHSDGIQTYLTGRGLVFNHNTVDQRDAKDFTAPVFITDPGAVDVTVTNNLLMGGTYSIQVQARGTVVVKNNMLVDRSWQFGPVDSTCGALDWSGNKLVKIDSNYRVTAVVATLPCHY
jgi:hypothetical protein